MSKKSQIGRADSKKRPTSDAELESLVRRQQKSAADIRRQLRDDWRQAIATRHPEPDIQDLIERARAAGFFDGEGHVSAGTNGGEFNCEIDQVDQVHLERFQAAAGGVGTIKPRKWNQRGKEQPRSRWKITNQSDLTTVWNAIGLFLSPSKQAGFASALAAPLVTLVRQGKPLPHGTYSVDIPLPKASGDDDEAG